MQKKKKKRKQQTRDHIINCKHLKEKEKCKNVQKKKIIKKGKNMMKGKGLKKSSIKVIVYLIAFTPSLNSTAIKKQTIFCGFRMIPLHLLVVEWCSIWVW